MAHHDRWLNGAWFCTHIARRSDVVWDYLLAIEQTPTGRTHLATVAWADEGLPTVGSRIDVTASLLWYRHVRMVCEVTRLDQVAGMFAYRVVEGPATTENEYRITPDGNGARFEMHGRLLVDSVLIRVTGPLLKLAEDRIARREVDRLKDLLERG